MIHFDGIPASTVLYIPFTTFGTNGASITCSGLAVTDIEIYKNGSTTQRASDAGYALLDTDGIDFDGITGLHGFSIDLADNTDSGFYSVGGFYWVVVSAITVDSLTVTFVAATFRIVAAEAITGKPKVDVDALLGTAWLAPSVAGTPDVNSKLLGGTAQTGRDVGASVLLSSGTGTGQVKLSSGYVAPNWGDVGNPTTTLNLSGTTVKTATDIATLLAALKRNAFIATDLAIASVTSPTVIVLTGGPTNDIANVMAIIFDTSASNSPIIAEGSYDGGSGELTLTAAPSTAIDVADTVTMVAVAAANTSVTIAAGGITSASFAAGAIDAPAIAVDALDGTNIYTTITADIAAEAIKTAAIQAKTDNLPSDPADASDVAAAFSTVNSTLATIAAYIDTEVAAIKSKTDNLPTDPADASDIAASFSSISSTLTTIAAYIDTEVAAIKAKTDGLPADTATTLTTLQGYVDTLETELAKVIKSGEAVTHVRTGKTGVIETVTRN